MANLMTCAHTCQCFSLTNGRDSNVGNMVLPINYTRWYPARCCENFLNKILRWNVKVVTPKILHGNIRLQTHYIWKHVILLGVNHSKIVSRNFVVWDTCYKPQKIDLRHKYVIWWMMTWRIMDGDMTHSGWWCGMLACWEKSNHGL
jgi:hypothetical protein